MGKIKKRENASKNQIVQSNKIARAVLAEGTGSVWDERILGMIVAQIVDSEADKAFQRQSLQIATLSKGRKIEGRDYRDIKKSLIRLVRSYYEITEAHSLTVLPIFIELKIRDNGHFEYELNPKLKQYYTKLESEFTVLSLPEFMSLSTIYAQRLFRILRSWSGLPNVSIPVKALHRLLDVPESLRKDFSLFRARILEPVHREINEKTGLFYEWEPIREGLRKVVEVRFMFSRESINAFAELKKIEQSQGGKKKLEELGGLTRDEHAKLQLESNKCFEDLRTGGKTCAPKRTKKCKFCQTRGRMSAKKNDLLHS